MRDDPITIGGQLAKSNNATCELISFELIKSLMFYISWFLCNSRSVGSDDPDSDQGPDNPDNYRDWMKSLRRE